MRLWRRLFPGGVVLVLLTLLLAGCQRAARYTPPLPPPSEQSRPSPTAPIEKPEPIDPELGWEDNKLASNPVDWPITFVHADTDPLEWRKLPDRLWHPPLLAQPAPVASLLGLSPYTSAALSLASEHQGYKIRIPLGLDDPRRLVPGVPPLVPPGNPITLAKWQLGRQLFYDKSYLTANQSASCSSCHLPEHGFTDGRTAHGGMNTPTLLNCVYNTHQFWDGRATYLEEVVQRTLEDERESRTPPSPVESAEETFRHVWPGAIQRLRKDWTYRRRFREVFGTMPTQDTLGKALATFLRTLLCGNSLHDRARLEQAKRKGKELEAADYEAVLDPESLKVLDREGKTSKQVAVELQLGYRLFSNLQRDKPANCSQCHSGGNFTDNGFHNLGVGLEDRSPTAVGHLPHVPVGLKDRTLAGAFKTPTLRSLLRTGPYFHNGGMNQLPDVVEFHAKGGAWNPYLDPLLVTPGPFPLNPRNLELGPEEIQALTLFLRALNGQDVDTLFKRGPDD